MEFLKELGAFGVGILMAISVGLLFWKADEGLSEGGRSDLAQWLRRQLHQHSRELDSTPPNLPTTVVEMFDKVFGGRHFSWRCWFMSCLFSILAVAIMTVIALLLGVDFGTEQTPAVDQIVIVAIGLTFIGVCLNLVPDYFSLIETRWLLKLMCRTHKPSLIFAYLALDVLLTFLLFCVVGFVTLVIFILSFKLAIDANVANLISIGGSLDFFIKYLSNFLSLNTLTFRGEKGLFAIFLYSTFFTSVWVWLTALGWGVTRLLAKSPPLLRLMNRALPIDTHPMRSIGEVAAVIVCLGYWVIALAAWIMPSGEVQTAVGS